MSSDSDDENKEKILEALQISVVEIMSTMAMSDVIFTGMETRNTFVINKQVGGLVRLMGAHDGI